MIAFILLLTLSLISPYQLMAQEATLSASTPNSSPEANPTISLSPTPTPDPALLLITQYTQDYLYNYDLYQNAYLDYVNKREVHTKYGTITTEKDKLTATRAALFNRNQTLKTYLMALRVHLDRYKNADPTTTEKLQIELSKWESWSDEQNLIVNQLNNQKDFTNSAKEFKKKYITIQQLVYTCLIQNEANRQSLLLQDTLAFSQLVQESPLIKNEGRLWLGNLQVKADLVNTGLKEAKDIPTKRLQYANIKFINFYPDAKFELNKSKNYLQEMLNDIKSVLIKFYPLPNG